MSNAEKELKEKIKSIRDDPNLTETEKRHLIQQAMMTRFCVPVISSDESMSCAHNYEKQCYRFKFGCCDMIYPCMRCHKEKKQCENPKLIQISCMQCGKDQPPAGTCIDCGIKFSNDYCSICYIWSKGPIFHCDKCGICRVGTRETLFHCDECGTCFNNSHGNSHSHTSRLTNFRNESCMICNEAVFDSMCSILSLDCGHKVHQPCLVDYTKHGYYKCGRCRKSLFDMQREWEWRRNQIRLNPVPWDMFPIAIGAVVESPVGKFEVLRRVSSFPNSLSEIRDPQNNPNEDVADPSSIDLSGGVEVVEVDIENENESENEEEDDDLEDDLLDDLEGVEDDDDSEIVESIEDREENIDDSSRLLCFEGRCLDREDGLIAVYPYYCLSKFMRNIHCNDCNQNSRVRYHYWGMECGHCHSFNTQE